METFLLLAIVLVSLVAFDLLAVEFGTDSRTEALDERVRLIDRVTLA
jgi:hypothetical protein